MIKPFMAALAACALFYCASAAALGTLVPAPARVDMVHDAARSTIYITNGGSVLRYHIPTATFLAPIVLGGQLIGIDLSPDGNTLAVADRINSESEQWVMLVRLSDLAVTKASMLKAFMEDGTFTVAFGADGSLFQTGRFAGSGWVPLRRLNLNTMLWTQLGSSVRQDTMLTPSGDGKVIALAESNISSGPWSKINVASGKVLPGSATGWFAFEIGANANGTQFAMPTYGGTFIFDSANAIVATIGAYAGPQPVGVAYHPVEPLVYFPWAETAQVRVYSATSLTQVDAYDFQERFSHTGNSAFGAGRTKLSRDGSLLMVSVTGGVRFLQMYAPLTAAPVTGHVRPGSFVSMGLKGAIGNGGKLLYSISAAPAKGTAVINAGLLTYTARPGMSGADTFKYVARYGRATAESTVSVTLLAHNRAPTAVSDLVNVGPNATVILPVLANDSDPDGDRLSITTVTKPSFGSTAIQADKIVFKALRNYRGVTSFTYTVSDGKGGTAQARVMVTIEPK